MSFMSPILVPARRCAACGASDINLLAAGDDDRRRRRCAICCMPSATARRPEPQTWLRPQAVVLLRHAGGRSRAWRAGFWPCAGGQHLAEDDLVDFRAVDLRALERRLDGDRAELVGGRWRRRR